MPLLISIIQPIQPIQAFCFTNKNDSCPKFDPPDEELNAKIAEAFRQMHEREATSWL